MNTMDRRTGRILLWVTLTIVVALAVWATMFTHPENWVKRAADPTAPPAATASQLPDPVQAGTIPSYLLNPDVTQATIRTTVCVSNWTDTVRPPTSYTQAIERAKLDPRLDPQAYEVDHWIAMSLGGAPRDARNLWPLLEDTNQQKAAVERRLQRAVCAGSIPLATAQQQMYRDWVPVNWTPVR